MTWDKRRKTLFLSARLTERAEAIAGTLGISFSHLVREAIEQYVERVEREAAERELAEACKNYRAFNHRFSQEYT